MRLPSLLSTCRSLGLAFAAAFVACDGGTPSTPRTAPAAGPPPAVVRCGGCHAHEADAWGASAHGRHAAAVATPAGGADAAIGSSWMQAYLRRDADGVHRIVPTCFDLREKGWRPVPAVLAEIAGAAVGPGHDALPDIAGRSFDVDCAGCHASGTRVRRDAETARVVASWRDLAIDCEACHGDPAPHADGRPGTALRLERLSPRGQVMVCGRCHGGPACEGDLPPREAETVVARLADHPGLFVDGSPASQAYQVAAFVRSPCFVRGGLTCTTCHDPHGPGLRGDGDVEARCAACHPGLAGRAHGHHDPAGAGGRCVACHLPALLPGLLRHQRSHRIGVPVPGVPGVPDACGQCHPDRDASSLRAAWRTWWGEPPAAASAVARAIAAARAGDATAPGALRAVAKLDDPHVRAAVATYLHDVAGARGDPSPEVRVAALRAATLETSVDDLRAYLADPEPRVRAEAAVALAVRGDAGARAHADDVALLARHEREHVGARWALASWALDDERGAEALAWIEAALAFDATSPDLWFLAAEALRQRHRAAAAVRAVERGVGVVAAACARGEPADKSLETFVVLQVERGRRTLAGWILDEAARRLPDPIAKRFAAMAERLPRSR